MRRHLFSCFFSLDTTSVVAGVYTDIPFSTETRTGCRDVGTYAIGGTCKHRFAEICLAGEG